MARIAYASRVTAMISAMNERVRTLAGDDLALPPYGSRPRADGRHPRAVQPRHRRGRTRSAALSRGMGAAADFLRRAWRDHQAPLERTGSGSVRPHRDGNGCARRQDPLENRSTNTGENVELTRRLLLAERGLDPASFLLVQKPYMERRSYATFMKRWPEKRAIVTSPQVSFDEYLARYSNDALTEDDVVGIMVGDLQRIRDYPGARLSDSAGDSRRRVGGVRRAGAARIRHAPGAHLTLSGPFSRVASPRPLTTRQWSFCHRSRRSRSSSPSRRSGSCFSSSRWCSGRSSTSSSTTTTSTPAVRASSAAASWPCSSRRSAGSARSRRGPARSPLPASLVGLGSGVVFGGAIYAFARFLYNQQASSDVRAERSRRRRSAAWSSASRRTASARSACRIGEELVDKIAQHARRRRDRREHVGADRRSARRNGHRQESTESQGSP